jgi:hypothetical protein
LPSRGRARIGQPSATFDMGPPTHEMPRDPSRDTPSGAARDPQDKAGGGEPEVLAAEPPRSEARGRGRTPHGRRVYTRLILPEAWAEPAVRTSSERRHWPFSPCRRPATAQVANRLAPDWMFKAGAWPRGAKVSGPGRSPGWTPALVQCRFAPRPIAC